MNQRVTLRHESCGIPDTTIREWYGQLVPEINRIKAVTSMDDPYRTEYASLALPHDTQLLNTVRSMVKKMKSHNPTLCIVIGIGGSSLGTHAVYEALHGALYNELSQLIRLQFVETIDSDYLTDIKRLMLREVEKGGSVVLNVISKSGCTTETVVNFEVLLSVLKLCYPNNYAERVVVTTDHNSPLADYAVDHNMSLLYIPKRVGGRYSVFSAVGLFPLGMMGVNLDELRLGAQNACSDGLRNSYDRNSAALNACITYAHYQAGIQINDMFLFSTALQSVGAWWRQLMGESLGKQVKSDGNERVGIIPTVSMGSADLHSVAQLYLGGPRRLLSTFVTVAHNNHEITLSKAGFFEKLVSNIHGKPVSSVMSAILQGTLQAYKKNGSPFTVVTLNQKKEYEIGYFLQTKMLEVMYLGFLLNVDPFDQPDVERYKRITREILAHG